MFKVSVFVDEALYIEPRELDVVHIKPNQNAYDVDYRGRKFPDVTQATWSSEIVKPLLANIINSFQSASPDEPPSPVCIKVIYQSQTGAEYLINKRFIWCPRGAGTAMTTMAR